MPRSVLILEQASLEIVPERFQLRPSCRAVEKRFGIKPKDQLLDDNFHHEIVRKLPESEKRGRPDVVHLALLDATSTPLFLENKIKVIIHTISDVTIRLEEGVRIPRSNLRFYGVMSKVLTAQKEEKSSPKLFEKEDGQSIGELISSLSPARTFAFSSGGKLVSLRDLVEATCSAKLKEENILWIVGGFPHGEFHDEILKLSDEVISISNRSLAAHVVTARLCYELERSIGVA